MDTTTIVLAIVVVALLVVVAWLLVDRQRSNRLRSQFGPEYRRAIDDTGSKREAERELEARKQRVDALDIRPLEATERERYAAEWRQVQAQFVDQPRAAVVEADRLIGLVMGERGYPVADFEQRAADVSVNHASVVEHYRAAHEIAAERDVLMNDTEQLRRAMVHYRALFDDLLGATNGASHAASHDIEAAGAREPELTRRLP